MENGAVTVLTAAGRPLMILEATERGGKRAGARAGRDSEDVAGGGTVLGDPRRERFSRRRRRHL